MPGGRPRKIESPEEMEARVDAFFAQCEANNRPPTVTGMALALGLSCRESLDEYGRRPEFSDTVKAAKSRVAAAYEARLWEGQPAGAIFALKNMGWSDRQEHAVSGSLNIGITPTENDL